MSIVYPGFLEAKLASSVELRAAVDRTAVSFGTWYETSQTPFFPDYPDHSRGHVEGVLSTASSLIAEEARQCFTPADAAVLVLATIVHDSAMHLSEYGFQALVRGSASHQRLTDFDAGRWGDLWDDFLFSARRWDDRKLCDVFGSRQVDLTHAGDPVDHHTNLTLHDRKLIGEFIRQHHARLAHEVAVFGVPAPSGKPIRIHGLGDEMRDIIGLIARSHALPLRICLDYLAGKYHRREYQAVHAPFLMVLLRIADHLQIEPERAPSLVFRYRVIPSLASQQEWKAHAAVKNVTRTNDDPECLEVQANPNDVATFVRLREWLSSLQREMDDSWALLGEVYGLQRQSGLDKLGLILRRVRSNLDDVNAFARMVQYVPERVQFTVARPDLLKLLIGPLYAYKPEIGIRELIQNAVDAVREFEFLRSKDIELDACDRIDQEADVELLLGELDATGHAWLTVSDKGIGMTSDTIRDYFLRAGASYRNSDAWKKQFEHRDNDEQCGPRSEVLRSGRFGIGVLAAFLLGQDMEVETRHAHAAEGLRFRTTLDTRLIELERVKTMRVGTVVKVRISAETRERLLSGYTTVSIPENWAWFCLDKPSVRCRAAGNHEIGPAPCIHVGDLTQPSAWHLLPGIDSMDVYWSFAKAPNLVVNGIFVSNAAKLCRFSNTADRDRYYRLRHPSILAMDPDGKLPLDLQRHDRAGRRYDFEDALLKAIAQDFVAYVLVNAPDWSGIGRCWDLDLCDSVEIDRGWYSSEHDFGQYFVTPRGYSPIDPWAIAEANIRTACFMPLPPISEPLVPELRHDAYFLLRPSTREDKERENLLELLSTLLDTFYVAGTKMSFSALRIICTERIARWLMHGRLPSMERWDRDLLNHRLQEIRSRFRIERRVGPMWIVATKDCHRTLLTLGEASMAQVGLLRPRVNRAAARKKSARHRASWSHMPVIEAFATPASPTAIPPNLVGQQWRCTLGTPTIPFSIRDRRKFTDDNKGPLSPYVAAYRELSRRHARSGRRGRT